jgi:hypothetical protein
MHHDLTKKTYNSPENGRTIVNELHVKREKFSEQEISALKGMDDLVRQVLARYDLDKDQALRDVDALRRRAHSKAGFASQKRC